MQNQNIIPKILCKSEEKANYALNLMHLTKNHWIDYYCQECLQLSNQQTTNILANLQSVTRDWHRLIEASFLSPKKKTQYAKILAERCARLGSDA
jgi:hypothetical protein